LPITLKESNEECSQPQTLQQAETTCDLVCRGFYSLITETKLPVRLFIPYRREDNDKIIKRIIIVMIKDLRIFEII
jgi:hypothetical protein